MTAFHTYTSQMQEPQRQLGFVQPYNEITNDESSTANSGLDVYEGSPDPNRIKTNNIPELSTQHPIELSTVNNSLDIVNDLVSATPVAASDVESTAVSTPVRNQPMQPSQLRNENLMTMSPSVKNNEQTPRNVETADHDSLVLLKSDQENQGDDTVFNKLFAETKPRVAGIFQHSSVIPEKINLQVIIVNSRYSKMILFEDDLKCATMYS